MIKRKSRKVLAIAILISRHPKSSAGHQLIHERLTADWSETAYYGLGIQHPDYNINPVGRYAITLEDL